MYKVQVEEVITHGFCSQWKLNDDRYENGELGVVLSLLLVTKLFNTILVPKTNRRSTFLKSTNNSIVPKVTQRYPVSTYIWA